MKFAIRNNVDDCGFIICLCVKYDVVKHVDPNNCESYLVMYGIDHTYTCWTKHEEKDVGSNASRSNLEMCESLNFDISIFEADRLQVMVDTIKTEFSECSEKFERIKNNTEKPLYKNYTEFTLLSAVLNLYN